MRVSYQLLFFAFPHACVSHFEFVFVTAMLLMLKGFDAGVIKFGLITCTKKVGEEEK